MRFNIKLLFFWLIFVFSGLEAQELDKFRLENLLREHVTFLASEQLEGRGLGTEGKLLAKNYIAKHFAESGLLPFDQSGYFQDFYLRLSLARVPATNVIGYLKGTDPVLANEFLVIGAHYDHLGVEEANGKTRIFHGADDNASGVAALIELARYFSTQQDFLKRSIIFIAFDAEESGLLGSTYFTNNNALAETADIRAMFSLDMVGMYSANMGIDLKGIKLIQGGEQLAEDIARSFGIDIKKTGDAVELRTDTKPFGDKGIPAIHVFTGMKSPYHKPQDTHEKLDYEGMALVTAYLGSLISEMSNMPELRPSAKITKQQNKQTGKLETEIFTIGGSSWHSYPERFYTAKKILSYGAGLAVEMKLHKNFGLQTDVMYLGDGSRSEEGTFRRHSLMIPVNLNVYLLNDRDGLFSTFFFGGPYFLKTFAGKNGGQAIDFNSSYNDREWGYQLGFGLDLMNWRITGNWPVGLTDIQKNPADIIKSKGWFFSFGYRF